VPCLARKGPTRCREEGLVGGPVDRTLDLPAEDAQLVAQDRDLKLRLSPRALGRPEQADDAAQEEIQERLEHGAALLQTGAVSVMVGRDRVFIPHGLPADSR
jgi:hypothetical protein